MFSGVGVAGEKSMGEKERQYAILSTIRNLNFFLKKECSTWKNNTIILTEIQQKFLSTLNSLNSVQSTLFSYMMLFFWAWSSIEKVSLHIKLLSYTYIVCQFQNISHTLSSNQPHEIGRTGTYHELQRKMKLRKGNLLPNVRRFLN